MAKTLKQIEAGLDTISPSDGYAIRRVIVGMEVSLHLIYRKKGAAVNLPSTLGCHYREIGTVKNPTIAQLGAMDRLQHFLIAYCRFINTGGKSWEVNNVLDGLRRYMHLDLPIVAGAGEDVKLVLSEYGVTGAWQHNFITVDEQYTIEWIEGSCFDVRSMIDVDMTIDWDGEFTREDIHVERGTRTAEGCESAILGQAGDETAAKASTSSRP